MRRWTALAVLALALAAVPPLLAQQTSGNGFFSSVNPANLVFTPINSAAALRRPTDIIKTPGTMRVFSFHDILRKLTYPLNLPPARLPSTSFPGFEGPFTTSDLPTMQVNTSRQP